MVALALHVTPAHAELEGVALGEIEPLDDVAMSEVTIEKLAVSNEDAVIPLVVTDEGDGASVDGVVAITELPMEGFWPVDEMAADQPVAEVDAAEIGVSTAELSMLPLDCGLVADEAVSMIELGAAADGKLVSTVADGAGCEAPVFGAVLIIENEAEAGALVSTM